MPLARILTRFPEQAGALSEELRHRGYTVEFSTPELAGRAAADLEIDFEICPEPDALSRAADLADQLHADVAVSPGVVGQEEHVAAEPVVPEFFQTEPENTRFVAQETADAEEPAREEDHTLVPDSGMAEPLLARESAPEVVPDAHEYAAQSHAAAATPFDDELDIVQAAAQDNAEFEQREEVAEPAIGSSSTSERAREFAAAAGKKSALTLEKAAVTVGELWASGRETAQEFWEAARQRAQEYHERAEIGRAERRAERQQKLLELERRRATAQERAAELEAAREAAAARLQELLRERGALTSAQPAPPLAATSSPSTGAAFGAVFTRKIKLSFAGTHRPHVEAVLMGVAAACLLFVVGLAVASFHTRLAISGSFNRPSSNGVTVQGRGVTVQAGAPAAPAANANPVRPVPAARTQPVAPAVRQRSSANDVSIRNFSASKPSPRRAGGSDRASDDVTVRHFGAQPSPPPQTAPRAQLRHYSDLDN